MSVTTSHRLPDALKDLIAKVPAFQGKTAYALMVATRQSAMDEALVRQEFHAEGEASYQDALRTNSVYGGADVKVYVIERVKKGGASGAKLARPVAQPLDGAKPMTRASD